MIGGLFNRLRTVSEVDGLTPIQRFGAGLDALILPEMRMGQQIRQQGAQQLAAQRRNSTIQELEKRANAGDAVAQRYLQGIQSGALDMKTGFAGYLNEVAANERMQRELNARAALAAAKPTKSFKLVNGKQLNETLGTSYPEGALFQLGSDGSAKQVGGGGDTFNIGAKRHGVRATSQKRSGKLYEIFDRW